MNTYIPTIIAAGQFDSHIKYKDMKKSPLRIVTNYELEYYFESGGISNINGEKHPMKKGNLIIGHPGAKRFSTLPFRCYYIHLTNVSPEISSTLNSLPCFMHTKDFQLFEEIFVNISNHFLSLEFTDNLSAIGELFILINHLKALTLHERNTRKEENILDLVQKYIDHLYPEELTVEILAQKCNVSVSYLYRLFSENLEISPHTAILNRRIVAARSMLINTNLSLNDIAYSCGFNSQAYFSDCFKKQNNGLTPSVFRKQARYTL